MSTRAEWPGLALRSSMKLHHPNAEGVARRYIGTNLPLRELGSGVEGVVYLSPRATTAVKVHSSTGPFNTEVNVYKRLKKHKVSEFQGFSVPQLVRFDPQLQVIEMSVVKVPFLLDFAGAALDCDPDGWSNDDEWWARIREQFDDDFPVVQSVFNGLVAA
jgi:hypothetical protein